MPSATPRRRPRRSPELARAPASTPGLALLVIDQQRLQRAAWARFQAAQKRVEKATAELHRHEEIDCPAYEAWLHRTFPVLVTTLRELHEEAVAKAQRIQRAQAMAYMSGRSVHRIWREQKVREQHRAARAQAASAGNDRGTPPPDAGEETFQRSPSPPRSETAREIYRRLVQQLHPDRGGHWTAARERLWHEVQHAWAAGDTDWLARLEVEWETAHEVLGPRSPLSRLYRAIEELSAAHRDIARKLHDYRESPQWRFTFSSGKHEALHARIGAMLRRQIAALHREIRPLDAMIAEWEHDWTSAAARVRGERRRY